MSRIIKRIDYRVRAEQLSKISLPVSVLTVSKDFRQNTELFTAKFISGEEKDSTKIIFTPTRGVLDANRYAITASASEEALGHVFTEVARTNFCTVDNEAMTNYIMCHLLIGVSKLLKEDGYYYYDSILGKWV